MKFEINDFIDGQRDLLLAIQKNGITKEECLHKCKTFLSNQIQQLQNLVELKTLHMNERGKLEYRLIAEEQVSLSTLKDLFSNFSKLLEEFNQLVIRLSKSITLSTSTPDPFLQELMKCRQEAINIMKDMLRVCVVLDKQPVCTNYEKKKNEAPNLVFLGAHHVSNLEISLCNVTAVNESDLLSASHDDMPVESVEDFKGFRLEKTKKTKTSGAKSNLKLDCITENIGNWFIEKDKLNPMEKGSAHKEFLRLRYKAQVKYFDMCENLTLLSLPFSIRKSSCQMYTFAGALMWYFFNTSKPYEDFTTKDTLDIATVLKMLVTRIDVIGRPLSTRAQDFLKQRLENGNLCKEGKVVLEALTRGPPTSKDDVKPSGTTRTVDEAIEHYGFFTWFYALAKSLDTSGYLNKLWIDGYIYDICDLDHIYGVIENPVFGFQTIIFRPSMSEIEKYQGEDINMGLGFFFKPYAQTGEDCLAPKVASLKLRKSEVEKIGIYRCLTLLKLEFIYIKEGVYKSLLELDSFTPAKDLDYHKTRYQMNYVVQLPGSKHCTNCHCVSEELNFDTQVMQVKKARTPSGESDHISSSSDEPNLTHKRREMNSIASPTGSHRSMESTVTNGDVFRFGNGDSVQVTSSSQPFMTPLSTSRSDMESQTGSPDASTDLYMSPAVNRISDFEQAPCENFNDFSRLAPAFKKRHESIQNCRDAFNSISLCNFSNFSDDAIDKLTECILQMAVAESGLSYDDQTLSENYNHERELLSGAESLRCTSDGYQVKPTSQIIGQNGPNDLTYLHNEFNGLVILNERDDQMNVNGNHNS